MSSERLALGMELNWDTVGRVARDDEGKLRLPIVERGPGVYRFTLQTAAGSQVYVGEATDVRKAFLHVRAPLPGQAANLRLQEEMLACLGTGGSVTIELCASVWIGFPEAELELSFFEEKTRRFIKAAAVAGGRRQVEAEAAATAADEARE